MSDNTRRKFEDWLCQAGDYEPEKFDGRMTTAGFLYFDSETENMWNAWEAALAHTGQVVDKDSLTAEAAPAGEVASAPQEPAPPNNLPDWSECAMRVANSDHFAKQIAEGGYGPEPDSKLATELHRFIYEYDDASAYRSAWFLHRLELLLNETRALATPATEPAAPGYVSAPSPVEDKDGARYRWLRDVAAPDWGYQILKQVDGNPDDVIDRARALAQEGTKK